MKNYTRTFYLMGFIASVVMMMTALYFEHVKELTPCPLCIFQRIAVIIIGLVCLLSAIHHPRAWGRKIYALLLLIGSTAGLGLALRHSWLQRAPKSEFKTCGPQLEDWLESLPIYDVFTKVLKGSGDCGEVVWQWLGLSIPEWTAIAFTCYIIFSLQQLFAKKRAH